MVVKRGCAALAIVGAQLHEVWLIFGSGQGLDFLHRAGVWYPPSLLEEPLLQVRKFWVLVIEMLTQLLLWTVSSPRNRTDSAVSLIRPTLSTNRFSS